MTDLDRYNIWYYSPKRRKRNWKKADKLLTKFYKKNKKEQLRFIVSYSPNKNFRTYSPKCLEDACNAWKSSHPKLVTASNYFKGETTHPGVRIQGDTIVSVDQVVIPEDYIR